ncbi:nodulation protein NodH [Aliisedimentitalea scapharcae]|uniref:Nodulation protein NodH n=1 Tax=Aliisedimentitalea scapharcae TaxID=1524259 RepID=A0ABZ2XT62_9RHOB
MSNSFDYFVIFAEMRTGSNFLETNLNAFQGLECHGEAFNPHFIGYPNTTEIQGVTQSERDADPSRLIDRIKQQSGTLGGFRFFHDHDPRVLELVMDDPRCAKIILTRNPLESYVSWKIAKATGQWKLTNVKSRKEAQAVFNGDEFGAHVEALQDFQVTLLNRLQRSAQVPFYMPYEDLQDLDVLNGLARWLGCDDQLEHLDKSLKRQNPAPITSKVANVDEMISALGGMDRFNLSRTPNFEPRRGAAVPSYVAAVATPLLYLPMRGGPEQDVLQWMADLDRVAIDKLPTKMNQKQLRQWKRRSIGHRSFTVLRHPVARAHAVFCYRILQTGEGSYLQIRNTLRRQFQLPIPKDWPNKSYSKSDHRAAFEVFLAFVKANLAGQTGIRVDAAWCTQAQALSSFGDFNSPDMVLREEELAEMLPLMAQRYGHVEPPVPVLTGDAENAPFGLAEIYDKTLEEVVADIYQRDYVMFGFGPWKKM